MLKHCVNTRFDTTGVATELKAAEQLNASQTCELADLKKAAANMTQSHQVLTQDLQSSTAQLECCQTQLSQLTAERQQLQQHYDAQGACYAVLESQLQERMQAHTEAMSAAQQELQGLFLSYRSQQKRQLYQKVSDFSPREREGFSLPMCCSQTCEKC